VLCAVWRRVGVRVACAHCKVMLHGGWPCMCCASDAATLSAACMSLLLPQVIATALHVIVNCVTAPSSLAYLLPPPGTAAGGFACLRQSTVCPAAAAAADADACMHAPACRTEGVSLHKG
jgi:hypothetical protein